MKFVSHQTVTVHYQLFCFHKISPELLLEHTRLLNARLLNEPTQIKFPIRVLIKTCYFLELQEMGSASKVTCSNRSSQFSLDSFGILGPLSQPSKGESKQL